MNSLWSIDDISSDNEDDLDSTSKRDLYDTGRRLFTFLIDVNEGMFDNDNKYIILSLISIRNILMKCIRESKTDLISIILFNTNDIISTNFEHVTNFIPLGDLNAEKIIKLEKLIESNDLLDINKYMTSETTLRNSMIIKNALWHCQSMRDKISMKISNHLLVMFTCQDSPKEDIKLTLQQAQDLSGNKKNHLTVIGFGDFNYDLFYKEILLRANNLKNDDWTQPNLFNNVDNIVQSINTHKNSLRCFSRLEFFMGSDISLKVALYNITKNKYSLMPISSLVTRNENTKVQTSTVLQSNNTGEMVLQNEISFYTKVQGEQINFSIDERSYIQSFQSQGIRTLGFINTKLITPYYTFGHSSFMIPSESASNKLYCLLLKKCLEMNQAILCSVVYRKSGKPRLCAMIPHLEDEMFPSGFFLKPLPYSDNIRSEIISKIQSINESIGNNKNRTIVNLIKSFSNPNFKIGSIKDPKVEMKWAAVEALALQRSEMEKIKDETLPKHQGMKRIFEDDD